jgi:hypothetical protein
MEWWVRLCHWGLTPGPIRMLSTCTHHRHDDGEGLLCDAGHGEARLAPPPLLLQVPVTVCGFVVIGWK